MTNHRRRMQTRNRNFTTPPGNWPEEHNRAVRQRKQWQKLDRAWRDINRATRRATAALAELSTALSTALYKSITEQENTDD